MPKALSVLEETLWRDFRIAGFPMPEREHKFHPDRKWAFDFCWPDIKLGVECEGLTAPWKKSRHTTNQGYSDDIVKYNAAARDGWMVLRYTLPMIKSRQAEKEIGEVLREKGL